MVLAIVLSVLGGLLELAGIGLVVREIRSDRRLASRYLDEMAHEHPPSFHGPVRSARAQLGEDALLAFATPDVKLKAATDKAAQDVQRVQDAAARSHYAERERFQSFIRDLLTGGVGQRRLGAVLLAVGIVLSVAGNVASSTS